MPLTSVCKRSQAVGIMEARLRCCSARRRRSSHSAASRSWRSFSARFLGEMRKRENPWHLAGLREPLF